MLHFRNNTLLLLLSLAVFSFASCEKESEEEKKAKALETQKLEAIAFYGELVFASYDDSYQAAIVLKQKIDAFVANPTDAGFQACKTAWLAACVPYGQTEAYRFYGGPIDDKDGPEGLINSWPLDESYVDYVESYPFAGIINNTALYPTLSKTLLEDLNQTGGATMEQSEVNVCTGYHAIEFLLWGQDLSASGPGSRPFTDYVPGATAQNQARRGQFLKIVAELLVDHLDKVRQEWTLEGNYRKALLASEDLGEVLGKIFTGLGEMSKGELAGERMFVAVDSKDQENEHSCFSDNTHTDILMNFQGIRNVYTGQYTRVSGSKIAGRSFSAITASLDPTKADAVTAAFADAETKIKAIPVPFDQAILNAPEKVLAASESLKTLSDKLSDAALVLGAKF